jgi:hypothetical protein
MISLSDLGRFFATLTAADVLIGVAVTGMMLILISDWRMSLLAFTVQYLLITVLLSTLVQLQVATVRMIAGGLVALMLYISARRIHSGWVRRARAAGLKNDGEIEALFRREPFVIGLPFRFIAVVLVAVSVITIAAQFTFLNTSLLFWLVSLWLCSIGLLLVAITRDALKLGMGLLTFSAGFGILYLAIEPSLLFYGLLVISDLVLGLAIVHLAGAPVRVVAHRRGES